MELDVRQAVVSDPAEEEKLLRPELTLTDWPGPSSARPHLHREHVDVFYVVEGELEFADTILSAGDLGVAPPGVVHWFVARAGRFLNVHAPGSAWTTRLRARRDGRRPSDEEIDTYAPTPDPRGAAVVVRAHEGEPFTNEQRTIRVKIAHPELCLFEFDSAPGHTGPRPHVHREHVDAFYVLDGELTFFLDEETVRATAGTLVAAPPGVVHTFANRSDARARFLNLHAPGMRFDEYFRRMAAGEDDTDFHASFDSYFVGD